MPASYTLLTDAAGKPLSQYETADASASEVVKGAGGAPRVRVEDGHDVALGALADAPAGVDLTEEWSLIALWKAAVTALRAIPGAWQGAWADDHGTYNLSNVVTNGGNLYIAILAHTAAADKEPGVSSGWETYWQVFFADVIPNSEKGAVGGVQVYAKALKLIANAGGLIPADDRAALRAISTDLLEDGQAFRLATDEVMVYDAAATGTGTDGQIKHATAAGAFVPRGDVVSVGREHIHLNTYGALRSTATIRDTYGTDTAVIQKHFPHFAAGTSNGINHLDMTADTWAMYEAMLRGGVVVLNGAYHVDGRYVNMPNSAGGTRPLHIVSANPDNPSTINISGRGGVVFNAQNAEYVTLENLIVSTVLDDADLTATLAFYLLNNTASTDPADWLRKVIIKNVTFENFTLVTDGYTGGVKPFSLNKVRDLFVRDLTFRSCAQGLTANYIGSVDISGVRAVDGTIIRSASDSDNHGHVLYINYVEEECRVHNLWSNTSPQLIRHVGCKGLIEWDNIHGAGAKMLGGSVETGEAGCRFEGRDIYIKRIDDGTYPVSERCMDLTLVPTVRLRDVELDRSAVATGGPQGQITTSSDVEVSGYVGRGNNTSGVGSALRIVTSGTALKPASLRGIESIDNAVGLAVENSHFDLGGLRARMTNATLPANVGTTSAGLYMILDRTNATVADPTLYAPHAEGIDVGANFFHAVQGGRLLTTGAAHSTQGVFHTGGTTRFGLVQRPYQPAGRLRDVSLVCASTDTVDVAFDYTLSTWERAMSNPVELHTLAAASALNLTTQRIRRPRVRFLDETETNGANPASGTVPVTSETKDIAVATDHRMAYPGASQKTVHYVNVDAISGIADGQYVMLGLQSTAVDGLLFVNDANFIDLRGSSNYEVLPGQWIVFKVVLDAGLGRYRCEEAGRYAKSTVDGLYDQI